MKFDLIVKNSNGICESFGDSILCYFEDVGLRTICIACVIQKTRATGKKYTTKSILKNENISLRNHSGRTIRR